ncbi:hypothetical protein BJ138DRAFT_1146466 [Hygrophoropsis aurantiaca]|uniref:Uncharacterized protein n=1 Tax=Hygrophoropsis aurantiaca TaxID=72124 RepID=A0ACB8AIG0_9AGAM|nr:hypothetical protein BJ138DRAFT_1146466 [Hygrophoropsis aurantiaca]
MSFSRPARTMSPPPVYDARSSVKPPSSTTLTPYLQLPYILSLTWLAYPILSLIFVIFRLQLSSASAQSAVANARGDLLTACQAAEQAATAATSMPRYMAIATNQQFADAINGTMNGARAALILALTAMEAIINFLIDIYRSTFLCFLELVVVGGLDLLISAVQEITSFLQSTLNSIVSGLQNDANSINSAIQSAVNAINKINPLGNIQAPQFNVSSLDALSGITIPTDFENALTKLNSSLPTVSSIKDSIENLIDTPFEAVKADINNTFVGLTFDPSVLPVPEQNTVSFCGSLDTSSVDNLGNDLLQITKIGTVILVVLALLLLAGHCALEWYKWRCLQNHLAYTRQAWVSDPTLYHSGPAQSTPTVTLSNHNLLMLQVDAQHPLLTRIANSIAQRLHFSTSQHINLRWFLHYIFHAPALACFLIGFFGLLSVQVQLIAISPLEAKYTAQAAASVQDLSTTIATQMNSSMYNQSSTYANCINTRVENVQSTINNGLFGWVNGTTTTLNDTLNNFYTDIQNVVTTLFNGTILETPAQDFIKCLIGSKVDALEEALTFLNENLNVDLPRVNESVLVLSPTDVNEITQPIATAAIGGGQDNSSGLIGRLVATYVDSLYQERLMFAIFMGLWGVVVLMGLGIVFYHSYGKGWIDSYKRRKWQREQRDGVEDVITSFHNTPPAIRVTGDAEKGMNKSDEAALRSFTPLPEPRSAFSLNPFGRSAPPPPPTHPLRSLEPKFEKSWDSFFRDGGEPATEQPSAMSRAISGPKRLMALGKKSEDNEDARPDSDGEEQRSRSAWFKPVANLFSKKSTPAPATEFVVNRPSMSSPRQRPQLTISTERAATYRASDFPTVEASPNRDVPSSAWSVSPTPPTMPWTKNIAAPAKKAVPAILPPPMHPQKRRNANVPTDVGSTYDDSTLLIPKSQSLSKEPSPLALPIYHAFEQRLAPPVAPTRGYTPHASNQPPAHLVPPQEKHKRSSTVPAMAIEAPEQTTPVTRLLTTTASRRSSNTIDPFATPFDDDARVSASPARTKRITNPFAGFAL